jgi:hypothetical protein
MTKRHRVDEPAARGGDTLERLRARVRGGGYLLLDSLDYDELVAMQSLLLSGEAEIVNSACKPFLVAKLDRVILPP